MDRESLVRLLEMGLSLDEIGRRFGRDRSTVGYWVRKHGLQAVNVAKHSPRGGIERAVLEDLVAEGLSIARMSERLGVHRSTISYWLGKHNLRTTQSRRREEGRRAKAAGRATITMTCLHHGETDFWMEGSRRISLSRLPARARGRPQEAGEGDPRFRGRRQMPTMRL
jgi:transposase